MERMQAVFERLQKHNLKLKPSKFELLKGQVSYLGHVVYEESIHNDPAKIEAFKSWPVLKSIKDVHCLIDFTGYYRKFVQGFAAIARPLNDLLVGYVTNLKARKKSGWKQVPFKLGPEQQTSLEAGIDKFTNPHVQAYADDSQPLKVHTDASLKCLGAVLY